MNLQMRRPVPCVTTLPFDVACLGLLKINTLRAASFSVCITNSFPYIAYYIMYISTETN